MIRPREIRIALTGALLFLVLGMVQGCASEGVTGPEPMQASTDEAPECIELNGVWICT